MSIGILYMGRNVKQFDKALEAFQRVGNEFPNSKVALDAEEYIPIPTRRWLILPKLLIYTRSF